MRIIRLDELKDVISSSSMTVVKVFNNHDTVYDIYNEYNTLSKMRKYAHVTFASLALASDADDEAAIKHGLYRLPGFPAFIVYCNGESVGVYTGTSNTTLRIMLERYL